MNWSTHGIVKAGLPAGFAYIEDVIGDCIVDAKYAGTDNFMGRPAVGYEAPLVVASCEAAEACARAADLLRAQGYLLKVFDGFRPRRAVEDFARWAASPDEERRKPIQYPNVDKRDMFALGYIAEKSGHSRGSSIDLTLVDMHTHQELDMGSIFDYMDPRSHHGAAGLTDAQERNRAILRDAMCACGFVLYQEEWWHYNLKVEPYPDTYFDFPIR